MYKLWVPGFSIAKSKEKKKAMVRDVCTWTELLSLQQVHCLVLIFQPWSHSQTPKHTTPINQLHTSTFTIEYTAEICIRQLLHINVSILKDFGESFERPKFWDLVPYEDHKVVLNSLPF